VRFKTYWLLLASLLWMAGCPEEGDDDVSDDDSAPADDDDDDSSMADDDDDATPSALGFEAATGIPVEAADTRATCLYDFEPVDGFSEVVLANYMAFNAIWFYEAGAYSEIETDETGSHLSTGCAVGDFDGDGQEDELMINADGVTHFERTGNGYEDLSAALPTVLSGAPQSVGSADINGDGRLDFVVGVSGGNDVVWLQDGNGAFADGGTLPNSYSQTYGVELVDLDGDNLVEAVVASWNQCRVYTFNGTDFEMLYTAPLDAFSECYDATVGEFNGDGNLDIAFACHSEDKAFTGDGALEFTALEMPRLTDYEASRGIATADFDLDGDDDLYIAREGVADVLLLQDSPGVFIDASDLLPTFQDDSQGVTVGDVDGDGDIDVSVAVNGQSRLLINTVY
jgi:hypothetical protein